jgi:putative acetyltransferase
MLIRLEQKSDHFEVENLTREAFWNLHVPGCDEHYLVHIMRDHPDFIPYLNFVAIQDNKIVGNIMYTKSYIINKNNEKIESISFGPISVLPQYQKKGIGSALIKHSIQIAKENNHNLIIIEGHPHNYCKHGFIASKKYNISNNENKYPSSLLVLKINEIDLKNQNWKYNSSQVYNIDTKQIDIFDKKFKPKIKQYKHTQEEFYIGLNSYLE